MICPWIAHVELQQTRLLLNFGGISEDKIINDSGNTYRKNTEVFALQGFEHICNSSLQSSIDEDPITEVIQQNDPQGVHVTCHRWHKTTVVEGKSYMPWSQFSILQGAHFSVAQSRLGSVHWTPRRWVQRWCRSLPAVADQSGLLLPSETGKS